VTGSGWSLGIDFGTSFTTGAMVTGDGPPTLVEIDNSRYLPSVVVIDRDGHAMTGLKAKRQSAVFPERAERVPKRALVAGSSVILGDGEVPVTTLVAAVLGRVYGEAVRFQDGTPPESVVLTHPARWGPAPLQRLREAASAARIEAPVFLPEPVAAAWWFAAPSAGGASRATGEPANGLVAVFDFGGGTLDTAVLREVNGEFAIAGPPGGDADLGGEDLDELLLGMVSDLARARDGAAWEEVFAGTTSRARRDMAQLRTEVTAAKEELSEARSYDLVVPGFAEEFRLTRPEVEELFGPALDKAVAEMHATITAAGAEPESLSGLYLTGGSSRMPLVADRLAASLEVRPRMRDDPKTAVVLGALTWLTRGRTPSVPAPAQAPRAGTGPAAGTSGAPGGAAAALARAEALLAAYEVEGLEPAYREAVRLNPDSATAWSGLGVALAILDLLYEAERAARKAVRLEPGLAVTQARLGIVLGVLDDNDGAVTACREALRLDPALNDARLALATALTNLRQFAEAQQLIEECAGSGDQVIELGSALARGQLRRAQQNYQAAQAEFQRLIESGHPFFRLAGLIHLGGLLSQQRNFPAARLAYERAIESGHPLAYGALPQLGTMLLEQNDPAGARALLESAINSGRPELVPVASFLLGSLLADPESPVHDPGGGRAAYLRAVDSGHAAAAPAAALEYAQLLLQRKDYAEARAILKRAVASGHPEVAPRAGYILAELLRELLHVDDAKAAYEFVAESDHPLAAMAAAQLGDILHEEGDLSGARAAYLKAADGEGLLVDTEWAWNFGNMLGQRQEIDVARAVFEWIIGSRGSHAPEAAKSLGDLLRDHGDAAGASAAYERAITLLSAPLPDGGPRAGWYRSLYRFGLALVQGGHPDLATSAFEHISNNSTGTYQALAYANAAKQALLRMPTLRESLNGAPGRITIFRKSTFFNWGNPALEIDEIVEPFVVGRSYDASASMTHDVTPGPHVITGDAKNKGSIIVDIPPGKEVRVQCTPGMDCAYFGVLG
jgi:tetratricopeptide (TPR) repeat protein/actin-like ATPase involved in cell morphogenesis